MITNKIRMYPFTGRFVLKTVCFISVLAFVATVPVGAVAEEKGLAQGPGGGDGSQAVSVSPPDQRIRRKPPQMAIDACTGKEEGSSCTFNSADGVLHGDCRTGAEDIFACRPFRGVPPQHGQQSVVPEKRLDPQPLPSKEPESLSRKPVVSPVTLPEKKTAESLPPPVLTAKAEKPMPLPTSAVSTEKSWFNNGGSGSYLVVAIITAGLTWYIFFRYNTLPLRRLREVTRQLANGNLSSRVGEGLVRRKDEVADLGRDVDQMADRIEKLVGAHQRLIRDVSHELRSPLARLNVALELARQSSGLTHMAPFDRIERESDRLNELIGQLLMLTQLESESGLFQRELFDISTIVEKIAQDADFEAKNNGRGVVVTMSEPLSLNGNKELLRQAIENLVRNATRYTAPETTVEIALRKRESRGRKWVHLEVRDYGPGVPESEINDIFRPFYRVNDARERQSGGTGVGLAISDRAVRLHGGSIRAINAPGTGLIMELELPL